MPWDISVLNFDEVIVLTHIIGETRTYVELVTRKEEAYLKECKKFGFNHSRTISIKED